MDPWIVCVCMYVCMYICMYVCIYVYVCVYAYSALNFVECLNVGYHTNITHVIMYSLLRFETPIFFNQNFPRAIQQNIIWFLQENSITILKKISKLCCCYIIIIIRYVCLLSQAFLPGTSLEPAVIPIAQASSFTLQYFPYYV